MIRRMRILVTGANGSGGSYLLEHLAKVEPGATLIGWTRNGLDADSPLRRLERPVEIISCDFLDYDKTLYWLQKTHPDQIYHLASDAHVGPSFHHPKETLTNNVACTSHLLESLRETGQKPRVLLCSTSEVYGRVHPNETPINESQAIRPANPYAVSKVTQDLLAQVYHQSFGFEVIITRMFTYLNPRRMDLFASSFAMQIAKIELGQQEYLEHGNLESVRTLLDVRDAMQCYWVCMKHGVSGEIYNLGGDFTLSVGEVLEKLIRLAKVPIPCRQNPKLVRPVDVTLQIPDTRKFRALTNWEARYSVTDSLKDLLDECRKRLQTEPL